MYNWPPRHVWAKLTAAFENKFMRIQSLLSLLGADHVSNPVKQHTTEFKHYI